MSAAIVAEVRARYGRPMTPQECVYVCNEVAYRLNGRSGAGPWGLHRKGGTNWSGLALDIVVNRDTQAGFDCLRDAEGAGEAQWGQTVPPVGGWQWEAVHVEWVPGGTTPPPVDPPPSGGTLEAQVAALTARVAALEARFRQAGQLMGGV